MPEQTPAVFRSAFGLYGNYLLLTLAFCTLMWATTLWRHWSPWEPTSLWDWWSALMSAGWLVIVGLFLWVALDTRYVIRDGLLQLRMGPRRKRLPLDAITAVRSVYCRGHAYGLGSDFITIEYADRCVQVSPRDRAAFIAAIGVEAVP